MIAVAVLDKHNCEDNIHRKVNKWSCWSQHQAFMYNELQSFHKSNSDTATMVQENWRWSN